MMPSTVTHITQNGRYQIEIERAATKGILGYKIKANGDEILQTIKDAEQLKKEAEKLAIEIFDK